ncbi:MAG TPA: SprT family zinc-dependent metalloprotease [Clostridia bacterium]|nr:SprT family zinc-dependent metalloprotease [Clostridia bacterium]HQO69616.1 SprT family zinc-dependent metalloprotease [Clostridia bacterium]
MHDYTLIRSRRKTISLRISQDCTVVVRAPIFCSKKIIDEFVSNHDRWIDKHVLIKKNEPSVNELTNEQIKVLKKEARKVLTEKTKIYSEITGLYPRYIKITSSTRRFGSCTQKNGICYSYRLMLYPDEAVDYVVVHELCHLKHRNHQKPFYDLVKKHMPDYKERDKLLKSANRTL